MGSTRAVNARSGLLGSDFGNANTSNQAGANQKAIDAINAERSLQVSSVFTKIDELTQQKVAAQKAEALGQANAYKDYLAGEQKKATEYAKSLGASGMTFSELEAKNPDAAKMILAGYDGDKLAATLSMDAAKAPAERINWKTDVKGNTVIVYGVNPTTGKVEYHTQDLPAGMTANDVKIVNDQLWSVSPDGKTATILGGKAKDDANWTHVNATKYQQAGKINKITGEFVPDSGSVKPATSGGGPGGSGGGSATVTKAAAVKNMTKQLAQLTGSDGFISPDSYTAARNAWTQEGLNPTDFDSSFKGFVNPNNPDYSIVKQ